MAPTKDKPEATPEQQAERVQAGATPTPDTDTAAEVGEAVAEVTVDFVEDLPEDTTGASRDSKYRRAVEKLRENPGKWGRLATAKNRNGARTLVYQLKKKFADIEWKYVNSDVYGRSPVKDDAAA